jgi:hypothetical protein
MKVVGEPERGKPDFRFDEGIKGRKPRHLLGHRQIAAKASRITETRLCLKATAPKFYSTGLTNTF